MQLLCYLLAYLLMDLLVYLFANMHAILIIPALIAAAVLAIILLERRDRKLKRFVMDHSTALRTLQDINAKFHFADVSIIEMQHEYDNEKLFDTVSPRDYLTYQLVYDKQKVKKAIDATNKNKSIYATYTAQVKALCKFGTFDAELESKFVERCMKFEKTFFSHAYLRPTVEFHIYVRLWLTKINGRHIEYKHAEFSAHEISEIIDKLEQKHGERYLNRDVWDTLCRVERAKVSNRMRFAIFDRDNQRCKKCGSKYDLEIDHIYPISKGGKTTFDNLQTLCHSCNTKKSNIIERKASAMHTASEPGDHICPNCGITLVLRNGRYGEFYGCQNYPHCKFTKQ